MASGSSSWAKLIGKAGANLQHGVDECCSWGLTQVRKIGERKDTPKKKQNKYLFGAKRAGRGVLKFFGQAGESYYKEYGKLKKDE